MTSADHHKWLDDAARGLVLSTDTLWQAMCAEWAVGILDHDEAQRLASAVADQITNVREITRGRVATPRSAPVKKKPRDSSGATEQQLPLD